MQAIAHRHIRKWTHKIPFQKFVPWRNVFEIRTHLSKQMILERLKQSTAWKPMYIYFIPPRQNFVGKVSERGFDLQESVSYGSALTPVFHGRFIEADHEVRLQLTASNSFTTLSALWCWGWAIHWLILLFPQLLHGVSDASSVLMRILLFLGVPAGVGPTITIPYWRKVEDGRRELSQLLNGKASIQ
jgi:hypothetical protein